MSYLAQPLPEEDRRTLQLYRRAAGRVYERVGRHAGHRFGARILRPGRADEADLIPDAEFVALLTAFRVIFATKERTNFGRVANILARVGDAELRDLVAQCRRSWKEIPHRPLYFSLHTETFDPAGVLDAWMNGEIFHQDEDLVARVDLLKGLGAMAELVLQQTVRDMCFPLLGLDNVCAMALGQPLRPLPDVSLANPSPDHSAGTG